MKKVTVKAAKNIDIVCHWIFNCSVVTTCIILATTFSHFIYRKWLALDFRMSSLDPVLAMGQQSTSLPCWFSWSIMGVCHPVYMLFVDFSLCGEGPQSRPCGGHCENMAYQGHYYEPFGPGLLQGCPLSLILFVPFKDRISRHSQAEENVQVGTLRIASLLFTHDMVLLVLWISTESPGGLLVETHVWNTLFSLQSTPPYPNRRFWMDGWMDSHEHICYDKWDISENYFLENWAHGYT